MLDVWTGEKCWITKGEITLSGGALRDIARSVWPKKADISDEIAQLQFKLEQVEGEHAQEVQRLEHRIENHEQSITDSGRIDGNGKIPAQSHAFGFQRLQRQGNGAAVWISRLVIR
jgi:hypothetical protein